MHGSCACFVQKHKPCAGTKFKPVEGAMPVCHDYQEIKIQESMQTLGMGSIPRSIVVVLEDDLVDTVKAGGKCWVQLDCKYSEVQSIDLYWYLKTM